MQREDYMIRMIAQMGRVLARIRRMLTEGKLAEAGDELERASRTGGLDLRLALVLDETSLEPMLRTGGEVDRPRCAFFVMDDATRARIEELGGKTEPGPLDEDEQPR